MEVPFKQSELSITGDRMFSTVFEMPGLDPGERQRELEVLSRHMGARLLEGEGDTPLLSSDALKGAAMLACVPSLEVLARGSRHSLSVAGEVIDNLQDLAIEIERSGVSKNPGSWMRGALSEVSILSIIWWGVNNGYFPEDSYAVLTDSSRDRRIPVDGYRHGFDIVFREGGSSPHRHLLQVKTSRKHLKSYAPGIKLIIPHELFEYPGPGYLASSAIMRALSLGDISVMCEVSESLKEKLKPARSQG